MRTEIGRARIFRNERLHAMPLAIGEDLRARCLTVRSLQIFSRAEVMGGHLGVHNRRVTLEQELLEFAEWCEVHYPAYQIPEGLDRTAA